MLLLHARSMQGKPLTEARDEHHGQEGVVLDADEGLGEGVVVDHGGAVEAGVQALEEAAGERKEGQVLQAHVIRVSLADLMAAATNRAHNGCNEKKSSPLCLPPLSMYICQQSSSEAQRTD